MSYIGKNPEVKSITIKQNYVDLAAAQADTARQREGRYVEIEGELHRDNGDGTFNNIAQASSASGTGIIKGGDLGVASPTAFSVDEGFGIQVDSTDPDNVTVTEVSWLSFGNVAVDDLAQLATYVGVDNTGAFHQQTVPFSEADHRQYIYLGVITHNAGTVTAASSIVVPVVSPINSVKDLADAIGPINVRGNTVTGEAGTLSINVSSGSVYKFGANFNDDNQSPSIIGTTQKLAPTVTEFYSDGLGGFSALTPSTFIDPTVYDDGSGTPAAITTRWSVKRVYLLPVADQIVITLGTQTYSNYNQARQRFQTETVLAPDGIEEINLIGFIFVRGNASDLSNTAQAVFLKAAKWDTISGSAGAESILEFDNPTQFPTEGEEAILYITKDDSNVYRWDGTAYTFLGGGFVQYADLASFPTQGAFNRIYLDIDTSTKYYWDGAAYAKVDFLAGLDEVEITEPVVANEGLFYDDVLGKFVNKQPYDAFIGSVVGNEYENTYSLNVNADGTIAEQSISGSGITVTKTGTGAYLVNYASLGLNEIPAANICKSDVASASWLSAYNPTTEQVVVENFNSAGIRIDSAFSLTIEKTGTDHKKTAVVNTFENADGTFEAIKTSREPNDYVLNVDASGNITEQNFPSSGITVSRVSAGNYVFNISSLGLSGIPNVQATVNGAGDSNAALSSLNPLSSAEFRVVCTTPSGSEFDISFSITISRTNSDYIAANDINFYEGEQALYGAVVSTNLDNSYENTYSLNVSASGAITEQSISGSGISVTNTGVGVYEVNYSSLGLTAIPSAIGVSTRNNDNRSITAYSTTSSTVVRVTDLDKVPINDSFSLTIEKTGQDHKQLANVNVFTNTSGVVETIKTSRQPNEYSLNVDAAGNITEQNIVGSGITVNNPTAGQYDYDITALGLSSEPTVTALSNVDLAPVGRVVSLTNTSISIFFSNSYGGSGSNIKHSIKISKTGADYNPIEDIQINLGAEVYNFPVAPDNVLIEKIENSTFDGSDIFRASFDPNDFNNGSVIVPVNAQGKAVNDIVNSGGNVQLSFLPSFKFNFPWQQSATSEIYGAVNTSLGVIVMSKTEATVSGGKSWIEFTYED